MRKKLIAGNWKLNKTLPEAVSLAGALRSALASVDGCDLLVAPVYTAIDAVVRQLAGSNIAVAAQDVFYEDAGAFTGAVSAPHLKAAGCTYTLVGHSERRQWFGETPASTGKRVQAACRGGLIPILCIGETLQQRQAGATNQVIAEQLDAGVAGCPSEQLATLVIAYEPVWAIGTGQVATPEQAQGAHRFIRERLRRHGAEIAAGMRILYGGSVKAASAAALLAQPDIDGALVGGASLDVDAFCGIVAARS